MRLGRMFCMDYQVTEGPNSLYPTRIYIYIYMLHPTFRNSLNFQVTLWLRCGFSINAGRLWPGRTILILLFTLFSKKFDKHQKNNKKVWQKVWQAPEKQPKSLTSTRKTTYWCISLDQIRERSLESASTFWYIVMEEDYTADILNTLREGTQVRKIVRDEWMMNDWDRLRVR